MLYFLKYVIKELELKLSPITLKRLERFRKNSLSYASFLILIVLYVVSLFADFIANDKPLVVFYKNKIYFPVLFFYPGDTFGLGKSDIPNYKELQKREPFREGSGNFMIFPPIPYGYNESLFFEGENPPTPPTLKNLLGTDDRGRDILTRLIYGYRISFSFALLITAAGMIIGVMIGALQGYYGGVLDISMQRFIEIISALPFLYIIIIISSSLGRSFWVLFLLFIMFDWIGISYFIRSEFYKLREMPFVEASRALGIGDGKIMFRHILPNALTPIITFLPFDLIGAIFSLSALDFLGFGLPPPAPSIGELIRQGMNNISSYWLSLFPAGFLFFILLLIAFVGEGVRSAFDPRDYHKME